MTIMGANFVEFQWRKGCMNTRDRTEPIEVDGRTLTIRPARRARKQHTAFNIGIRRGRRPEDAIRTMWTDRPHSGGQIDGAELRVYDVRRQGARRGRRHQQQSNPIQWAAVTHEICMAAGTSNSCQEAENAAPAEKDPRPPNPTPEARACGPRQVQRPPICFPTCPTNKSEKAVLLFRRSGSS
jgi:hypothetical protein